MHRYNLLRKLSIWFQQSIVHDKNLTLKHFHNRKCINMEAPFFSEGNIQIYGSCENGYEPVKDAFIQNFVSGQEINSSICVYVQEKCVIDMYGTSIKDTSYNSECLQVIHLSLAS